MLSADDAGPYDRPNLSKDYLAGNAPEEWIPLRSPDFYREHGIELKLGARAVAIDPQAREVRLADGVRQRFGALLLATDADGGGETQERGHFDFHPGSGRFVPGSRQQGRQRLMPSPLARRERRHG